jgi:hypothetical protein
MYEIKSISTKKANKPVQDNEYPYTHIKELAINTKYINGGMVYVDKKYYTHCNLKFGFL